jgi:hypothetical protein
MAAAAFDAAAFVAWMEARGGTVYACDFHWDRQLSVMTVYPRGVPKSFDPDEMLARLRQYHQDPNGPGKLISYLVSSGRLD